METVLLEQGSQEWVEYRLTKVGASEISNLFGINPFCSAENQTMFLLGLKLGFNQVFINDSMKAGNDNEDDIVREVEEKYGIVTQPLVGNKGNISASFDGITFDNDIVVEVKYSDYTYHYVKENGFAPPHYELQVQQQLLVSGANKGIFAVMHTGTRDVQYCEVSANKETHNHIEEKVKSFFELMQSKEWKEEDFNEDRDDEEWRNAVADYKDAKSMEQEAKNAIAKAKEKLIAISHGVRSKGYGCTVYPIKGKTTTNWSKLAKDNKLEVTDEYKKVGSPSWGVKIS